METEEVKEPAGDPPVTTPDPQEEPVVPEKEPGGDSPEDVYARKEYRTRKKVEAELQQERIEKARLEERVRALEATRTEKPPEKIYTAEEVQAFIDSGQLKPAIGAAYLARVEAQAVIREAEERQTKQAPIVQARTRIAEYVKLIPGLADQTSDEFLKASTEYADLVSQGYADNDQTRALAIKIAHGDLAMLQRKAAVRDMNRNPARIPVDGSGGGSNGNKQADFSHAPAHLQEYWKKAGLNEKEQKQHFSTWQKQQAAKK